MSFYHYNFSNSKIFINRALTIRNSLKISFNNYPNYYFDRIHFKKMMALNLYSVNFPFL